MGVPSPQAGDSKVLYSITGTIASGGPAVLELGSFTLPVLAAGQYIKTFHQIQRLTGAEAPAIGTHITTATIAAGRPNYYSAAGAEGAGEYMIFPSMNTAINIGFFGNGDYSISPDPDTAVWGDITAAHTIFLNGQQRAASTFKYQFIVTLFGSNVKG
jgi:hypothetical protein